MDKIKTIVGSISVFAIAALFGFWLRGTMIPKYKPIDRIITETFVTPPDTVRIRAKAKLIPNALNPPTECPNDIATLDTTINKDSLHIWYLPQPNNLFIVDLIHAQDTLWKTDTLKALDSVQVIESFDLKDGLIWGGAGIIIGGVLYHYLSQGK